MNCELQDKIFSAGPHNFNELAVEVFRFQYKHNNLYRLYADTLRIDAGKVDAVASIPFLPVSFFKHFDVVSGDFQPEVVFESSGTTATGNSRHLVRDVSIYRRSFSEAFRLFYGPVQDWCIIGLLPSYLERGHSSLVSMVDTLIRESGHPRSGFYLYAFDNLAGVIAENEKAGQKTLLVGVTFALLDFAEKYPMPLLHTVVMETGGMKGRRKEITRTEVHETLRQAWQLGHIHSEYGMTELLSQAYSRGDGIFRCPPWMKVVLREEDDPLSTLPPPADAPVSGLVNVIDLANIYSCSFLAIDDIGKLYPDGSFEISGRMDLSDVRGCSLMYDL